MIAHNLIVTAPKTMTVSGEVANAFKAAPAPREQIALDSLVMRTM